MVGESVQVAAAKTAAIEMKKSGILQYLFEAQLKLSIKVIPKLARYCVIPLEDMIEIRFYSFVESKFHVSEVLSQARGT
jgi:hypothetical protein